METKKEYVSIAEFAEKVNVSKQAIYKQAKNENSRLAPYIKRDGKKTLVSNAAFDLYEVELENPTLSTESKPIPTQDNPDSTLEVNQEVDEKTTTSKPISTENSTLSADYIEFLKAEIAELKSQNEQKDKALAAMAQEKDQVIKQQADQLAALAQQLADIANKALITTSQQQYLTAAEKQEQTAIEDTEIKQEKKSIWKRLFR